MKKLIYAFAIACIAVACEDNDNNENNPAFQDVTVEMGAGSTNDVYYSLTTGEVNTVNRADWDIAFSTPLQGATIIINEGAGVELYSVGDTNDWNDIDENTITGLEPRFNDKSDWDRGAFNLTATGFPNYGWGTYHAGNPDHNVGGDSLFVIKAADGSYKKLLIRVKMGATGASHIRYANLDNSDETVDVIPTLSYVDRNFIHYSLVDKAVVEAEPDMETWDLLFTRYIVKVPSGPGTFMNYPVTGVLSNKDVSVSKVEGHPEQISAGNYDDATNAIGYDWKVTNQLNQVFIVDSISYFIQSVDGNDYQLYFTEYGGLNNGTIDFKVRKVE